MQNCYAFLSLMDNCCASLLGSTNSIINPLGPDKPGVTRIIRRINDVNRTIQQLFLGFRQRFSGPQPALLI